MEILTYEGFKALHADAAQKADQPKADLNAAQAVRVQLDKGVMPWWGDLIVGALAEDHKERN